MLGWVVFLHSFSVHFIERDPPVVMVDLVLKSTFAYSLNHIGTPVLVVEMGVGMRITQSYGNRWWMKFFS